MPLVLSCGISSLCVFKNRCLKLTCNGGEGSDKWRKTFFLRTCSHCAANGNGRSTLIATSVFNLVAALNSWLTLFTQSSFCRKCLPDSLQENSIWHRWLWMNLTCPFSLPRSYMAFQASLKLFTFETLHGHYKRSQWVAEWRLQSTSALSDTVPWGTEITVVRKSYLGQK